MQNAVFAAQQDAADMSPCSWPSQCDHNDVPMPATFLRGVPIVTGPFRQIKRLWSRLELQGLSFHAAKDAHW